MHIMELDIPGRITSQCTAWTPIDTTSASALSLSHSSLEQFGFSYVTSMPIGFVAAASLSMRSHGNSYTLSDELKCGIPVESGLKSMLTC